ncbi:hypothetical protein F0562_022091 [Nyssa sinensis]|uniref:RING-type domain-containing protein n=1 Tax=Nyssa sinensis TaxID=561372 RepID=A0A5J5BPS4_9ASTE|nr:hypothetical protein F0562_022091 [Nyssa sinensis]
MLRSKPDSYKKADGSEEPLSPRMDEQSNHSRDVPIASTSNSNSIEGPLPSSPVHEEQEEEHGQSQDEDLQHRQHHHLHRRNHNHRPLGVSYRLSISISDATSTNMRDDVWSCLIVLVTFWFFAASMTLILGFYGSENLPLGPNCSRLIKANPFFVQSIKVQEIDESKHGPMLYGFYEPPPLDVELKWSETHIAFIQSSFHKEWQYFLNKGSEIDISYSVKSPSSAPLSLIIAQGRESLVEWIEDPSYPNTTLSWNIIHGNGEVEVQLNFTIKSFLYNTTWPYYKCSLGHQLCSLKLFLLRPSAAVLTSPGPEQGVPYSDGYVKLSYGPRWITYFVGSGATTVLILLALRICNMFQLISGDRTGLQAGEMESERAPLLSPKDDDLLSWGSSYDSLSHEEEEVDEWLAVASLDGRLLKEGESNSNSRRLCVICFDAQRDCFFLPCGHCATCFTCGTRIAEEAGACPICCRTMKKVDNFASQTKTIAGHNLEPTPWHLFPLKTFHEETRYARASKIIQCSYLTCQHSTSNSAPQRKLHYQSRLTRPVEECPEFFRWIHYDLEPWARSRISLTHLMEAQKLAAFRVVIVGGKLYVDFYYACVQSRAMFTVWGLLQLLRRYPGMVPDVDLMFECMDKPSINRTEHEAMPLPLFRYCTTPDHLDIPFPDWSFWGWPEINLGAWDEEFRSIKQGSQARSWPRKWPIAYWKGNPDVNSPIRTELLQCNDTRQWRAQIMHQDWQEEAKDGFEKSKLSNQCNHRYKIYAEGYAWSVSLKYIVSCGSLSLIISPEFEDFFSRGLMPKKNYWPVSRFDLCRSIKYAVEWGNAHPAEAEAMGRAGQDFMESLSMDRIYDYMYHLITEYSKLQDFKPVRPSSAQEVCAESLLCFADDKQRQFLKRSVSYPSQTPPCTLQPSDSNLIKSWIEMKRKIIKDVQDLV